MNFKFLLLLFGLLCWTGILVAQESEPQNTGGRFSGGLEATGNFYIRDSIIGAANIPQYDRQLFGTDAWLTMNYSNWGFDFGVRFDLFNNSQLLNPQGSYTAQGIGRWFVHKSINKFSISAGYLYDQIGSGIIFRSYEARALGIDNALTGLQLSYDLFPDWQVMVFSGRQKQQFDLYGSVLRGLRFEGFYAGPENSPWTLSPGFGVVARGLDDASMNNLVATLNTYLERDAFIPKYNTYAASFYNTLTYGPFVWYAEAALKTKDNLNDPFGVRETVTGDTIFGTQFYQAPGTVFYTTLSYAAKGLGITLEAKRTENFSFRTRPQEELNRGLVNFLPPVTRVNTYRLPARYNAATQELGELALQGDISYALSKRLTVNFNAANITDLDDKLLYREFYTEFSLKNKRKWLFVGGLQLQKYNQEIYEFKPNVPMVNTVTPFADFLYRIDRKKSIRFEAQYMHTEQDFGSWIFGLAEFSVAPNWTFTVSDMYNNKPTNTEDPIHYPRFDVFYSYRAYRMSLSYIKQVEGVVCTGGVCRLEPAFSGVRLTVNSTF